MRFRLLIRMRPPLLMSTINMAIWVQTHSKPFLMKTSSIWVVSNSLMVSFRWIPRSIRVWLPLSISLRPWLLLRRQMRSLQRLLRAKRRMLSRMQPRQQKTKQQLWPNGSVLPLASLQKHLWQPLQHKSSWQMEMQHGLLTQKRLRKSMLALLLV